MIHEVWAVGQYCLPMLCDCFKTHLCKGRKNKLYISFECLWQCSCLISHTNIYLLRRRRRPMSHGWPFVTLVMMEFHFCLSSAERYASCIDKSMSSLILSVQQSFWRPSATTCNTSLHKDLFKVVPSSGYYLLTWPKLTSHFSPNRNFQQTNFFYTNLKNGSISNVKHFGFLSKKFGII